MSLSDLLAQNRAWAAAQTARDPDYFRRMRRGQNPRVLWIGCADSRVPAEQVLGCGPGDLFVHRNVANIVAHNDINIAAVVQFGTQTLGIADVVLCGHYGCGGVRAACAQEPASGSVGDWLAVVGRARRAVDAWLAAAPEELDLEAYLGLVVEENVRLQVKHLARLPAVRDQWSRTPGIPRLHGWVYDVGTGIVKVVIDGGA
jgi:carbonic anhydrase